MNNKSLVGRVLAFLAATICSFTSALAAVDISVYARYAELTIAGHSGTETLTDFPVPVRLTESQSGGGFHHSDCLAEGGRDLCFLLRSPAGFIEVPYEVESWDSEGQSLVWLKLPRYTADRLEFVMLWGGPVREIDSKSVWSKYVAVIHGGSSISNSVGNALTAVSGAAATVPTMSAGVVGGGITKSGSSIGVNLDNPSGVLDSDGTFTVSGWFYRNGKGVRGSNSHILCASQKGWNVDEGFMWLLEQGKYLDVASKAVHTWSSAERGGMDDQTWYHLAFAYDKANTRIVQYMNGTTYLESSSVKNLVAPSAVWSFGSCSNVAGNDPLVGSMDELRVFNGAASADWIAAEHESMSNQNLATLGTVFSLKSNDTELPAVATISTRQVGYTHAQLEVVVGSLGDSAKSGALYFAIRPDGSSDAFDYTAFASERVTSAGFFTYSPRGLQPNTAYEVSAYVVNNRGKESARLSCVFTTATAADLGAAIQANVTSVVSDRNGRALINYDVAWPGEGAQDVTATVNYGTSADDLSSTASEAHVIGTGTLQINTLLPGRTYYFRTTFDNGLGGDPLVSEVSSLTTTSLLSAPIATELSGSWTSRARTTATEVPAENNVLRGLLPSKYTKPYTESNAGNLPLGQWGTDGVIRSDKTNTMGFKTGCELEYTFDTPVAISEFRFYTADWSGRGNFNISSVSATLTDDSTFEIAGAHSRDGTSIFASFAAQAGTILARDVKKLTIVFGNQNNDGVHYQELEALAFMGALDPITVVRGIRESDDLGLTLAFPALYHNARLYACVGESWNGDNTTNGWTQVIDCGTLPAGTTQTTFRLANAAHENFVRICAIDEVNEEYIPWTDVLAIPDLEAAPAVPVLAPLSIESSVAGNAKVSCGLLTAGADQTGAELKLVYRHGDFTYTNAVASGSAALGDHVVELTDLLPGYLYSFSVIADNGVEGGLVGLPPVMFTICEENYGAAMSDENLLLDERWPATLLTPSANNVLAGLLPVVEAGSIGQDPTGARLTDGIISTVDNTDSRMGAADNTASFTTLRWDLPTATALEAVKIYCRWGDTRANISLDRIEARNLLGEWALVPGSRFDAGLSGNANVATLKAADDKLLTDLVDSIRICFTNSTWGQWRSYREVEAISSSRIVDGGRLFVDATLRDGNDVVVRLARTAAEARLAGNVYLMTGPTAGNETGWTKVGTMQAGDTAIWVRVPISDDVGFIRFALSMFAQDGYSDSTVRQYSPSILVKEISLVEGEAPFWAEETLDSVGPVSAVFNMNVLSYGAGATSAVAVVRYCAKGSEQEQYATLVSDGDKVLGVGTHMLVGLLSSTEYIAYLGVSNNLGRVAWSDDCDSLSFHTFTTSAGEVLAANAEGATVSSVGADSVFKFLTDGTVEVTQPGWVEMLLVGGGGGGGGQTGGGGGAGGFVSTNVFLEAGSYVVQVGAGGTAGDQSKAGGRGGDTIFRSTRGDGISITALGGGGGDEWDSQRPQGTNFASGGGATSTRTVIYPGTPGQGHDGGAGDNCCGGGGGGAGAPGLGNDLEMSVNFAGHAGKGGDGCASRITGTLTYYAGGGGGGTSDRAYFLGGWGGLGGGGRGRDYNVAEMPEINGVDGLGGGGGGGSGGNAAAYYGGKGGCGCAILRFTPAPIKATESAVALTDIVPVGGTAKITARVISTGRAANGVLKFAYGVNPSALDHEVTLSSCMPIGSRTFEITDLRSNQPYYGRLSLTCGSTSAVSGLRYFVTKGCDDATIDVDAPRLADVAVISNRADLTMISGRVKGVGTELKLLVGTKGDQLQEVSSTTVFTPGEDGYDTFVLSSREPLALDTVHYFSVQATNAAGADRTELATFRTPQLKSALPSGWQPNIWSVDQATPGVVKFSVRANYLGAGENSLLLYLTKGDVSDADIRATDPVMVLPVTDCETQVFNYEVNWDEVEWGAAYSYAFAISNVYEGASYFTPPSRQQNYKFIFEDNATYTWTGAGDGSSWTDPQNWSSSAEGSFGWPNYGSIVTFSANTEATITLDRDVRIKNLGLNVNGLNITFRNSGEEQHTLTATDFYDIGESRKLLFTIDGCAFVCGRGENIQLGPQSEIRVLNGGWLQFNGRADRGLYLRTAGCRFEVSNGSTFKSTGGIWLARDSEILIDDATFDFGYLYQGASYGNGTIRFRGAHPKLTTSGYYRQENAATTNVFEVPVGGYASAPIVHTGSTAMFDTSANGVVLVIDPASPALQAGGFVEAKLLESYCGIANTGKLAFDLPGAADSISWRYGANAADKTSLDHLEPASSGEAPTSLWVSLCSVPEGLETAQFGEIATLDCTETSVKISCELLVPASVAPVSLVTKFGDAEAETTTLTGSTVKTFAFNGLTASTDYVFTMTLGELTTNVTIRTMGADSKAVVKASSGAKVSEYGPYTLYVFDDPATVGTLSLEQVGPAEILVVGGGGSGSTGNQGNNNRGGGGGGGGGVIHRENAFLMAGDYTITVGAGAPRTTTNYTSGKKGGNSTLNGNGLSLVAVGGGAGSIGGKGGSGGCGGGGGSNSGAGGDVAGYCLGNPGGKAWAANDGAAGGGGGASSVGGNATSATKGGDGGNGLTISITGDPVVYAAGGPGGGSSANWGSEGLGYGGIGSGGRGGCGGNSTSGWNTAEEGRDGIVIVRLLTTALNAEAPILMCKGVDEATLAPTSADIAWELFSLGAGATSADAKLVWTLGSDSVYTNDLASARDSSGISVDTVRGLAPGAEITAQILVVNDLGAEALSDPFTFKTPSDAISGDASAVAGLWQVWFSSANKAWTKRIMDVAEGDAFLTNRRRELGTIAAYLGGNAKAYNYVSELWNDKVYWNGNSYQAAYCGYMKMQNGLEYQFRGNIDDDFHVEITNLHTHEKTVLVEASACVEKTSPVYNPTYTGWYYVEFRFSDSGSGSVGGRTTDNTYKNTKNFGYSSDGGKTWQLALDPGDGSLFQCERAETSLVLTSALIHGDDLLISVLDREGAGVPLSVVYGDVYGGESIADWTSGAVNTGITLGDVRDASYQVVVTGAASARYIRVCHTVDGFVTWSNTIFLPEASAVDVKPVLEATGDPSVNQTSVSQTVTVLTPGVGQTSCDLYMAYGLESGVYTFTNKVASAVSVGSSSVTFSGLRANRTYSAVFFAVNEAGQTSADTAEVTFTTGSNEETQPAVPGPRTITIASRNATDGVLTSVDLTFGACEADFTQDLYVAYGAVEGDPLLTNGWTTIVKVSDTPVTAATTSWHYDLPDGWGSSVTALRFFFGSDVGGSEEKSVKAYYVTDGLMAMLDGEDNAGTGVHDPNAQTWVDLSGNGADVPVASYLGSQLTGWNDKSLQAKACNNVPFAKSCSDYVTIEICAKHNNQYQCLFNSGDGLKKMVAVKNNTIQFYNKSNCNYAIDSDRFQAAAVHSPNVDAPSVFTNGVSATRTASDSWGVNSSPTCLGRGADSYSFTGEYYAIRLYNRALTAEELAANARIDAIRFLDAPGSLPSLSGLVFVSSSETILSQSVYLGPVLVDNSITVSGLETGDAVTISGTVSTLGDGGAVTILHQIVNADGELDWAEYPATVNGALFAGTILPAFPGKKNSYVVRARDAAGRLDQTPVLTFTPLGASELGSSFSAAFSQRTATLTYSLTTKGAGDTYAYMMTTDANTDDITYYSVVGEPVLLTTTGTQKGTITFTDFATSASDSCKSVAVMISNACSHVENGCWTSYKTAKHNGNDGYRIKDAAVYTWTGGTDGGDWTDPANWSSSKDDCLGYPNYGSTARFDGEAVVRVRENVVVNQITTGSAGTSVRILGHGEKKLEIRTQFQPAQNTTVTFDERLVVSLGARLLLSASSSGPPWEKARVNVFGDARFTVTSADGICLGGTSTLCVSNATVSAPSIYFAYYISGGTLALAGETPLVTATKEIRQSSNAACQGGTIYCTIPVDGYAQAPVRGPTATVKFGGDSSVSGFAGCGPLAISVDPASGALKRDGLRTFPIVSWVKGVTVDRVTTGDLPNAMTDSVVLSNVGEVGPWVSLADATEANTIGVKLYGTQIGRPVVRDLTLLVKSEDSATFTAYVTPGETAPNAAVRGVLVLKSDDPAIEDVETIIPFGTVTAADELVTFTLSQLIPGTNYTFSVEAESVPVGSEEAMAATAGPLAFSTDTLSPDATNPKFSAFTCTTTDVASAVFTYFADKLGYGATKYDLSLVYAHDDCTYTNTVASSSVLGELTYTLNGLKVDTSYTAFLFATNDVGGKFTSETVVFRTKGDEPTESTHTYKGATVVDYIRSTGCQSIDTGVVPTKDGTAIDMQFGQVKNASNQTLFAQQWQWPNGYLFQLNPSFKFDNNKEVPGYADGLDYHLWIIPGGIVVLDYGTGPVTNTGYTASAQIQTTLSVFAPTKNNGTYGTFNLMSMKIEQDGQLVRDFLPVVDKDGVACLYDRVSGEFFYDVIGTEPFLAGEARVFSCDVTLALENTSFDGSVFMTDLVREKTDESSEIIAVYGAEYGSANPDSWEHQVVLPVSYVAGQDRATVSLTLPEGTRYVRFMTTEESSSSVFVPDCPITRNPSVVLKDLVAVSTTVDRAAFSYNLVTKGTDATSCEFLAIYGHDDYVRTNRLVQTQVLGLNSFTLEHLRPNTTYTLSLTATNNVGGVGTTEAITFVTLKETRTADGIMLPDGYQRLEYVESTGAQYVDTGVKPTSDWSFDIDFAVTTVNSGNNQGLMGGNWAWNDTWLFQNRDGVIYFNTDGKTVANVEKDVMYHTSYANGTTVTSNETYSLTATGLPKNYARGNLAVFAADATGSNKSKMRLGGLKLFDNGVLVRQFIPVLDTDGVAALYDTVTGQTFYSKTSTALVAGPVTDIDGSLIVSAPNFDGANLGGTLLREVTGNSVVLAYIGTEYGGAKASAWDRIITLDPSFTDSSLRLGFYLTGLEGANYVRFHGEREGWSDTVYLPEMEIAENPNPILTTGGIKSVGATSLALDCTVVSRGTGATTCSIIADYGTEEGSFDRSVTLAQDLMGHGEFTISGLTPQTTYWIRLRAANDIDGTTTDSFVLSATTPGRGLLGASVAPAAGGDARYFTQCRQTDLTSGERVLVFSVTTTNASSVVAQPATLTITEPGYAELLVVGGGGGHEDPTYSGFGGGGAGGLIHQENYYFEPGEYKIIVGRGALMSDHDIPSSGSQPYRTVTAGTASIISNAMEQLLIAYPGGIAGRDKTEPKVGTWGSGAGASSTSNVGTYTPEQGNVGGTNGGVGAPGGGGGASTPGQDAYVMNGLKYAGNGGDGILCEITGEPVYYAGGGGGYADAGGSGSAKADVNGRGGLGGGGQGGGTAGEDVGGGTASGVDGTGGGAGGSSKGWTHGGSGTVILRFFPTSTSLDAPAVQLGSICSTNDENTVPGVEIKGRLVSEGVGVGVTVDFEYGLSRETLDKSIRLAEGELVGLLEYTTFGFLAKQEYFGRLRVTDAAGNTRYSTIQSFTTTDGDDSAVSEGAPRITEASADYSSTEHQVLVTLTGVNLTADGAETSVSATIGESISGLAAYDVTLFSSDETQIVVALDGLEWDTDYFAKFSVSVGSDRATSAAIVLRAASESKISTTTATISADNAQEVTFSANLITLGAGTTKASLYLRIGSSGGYELVEEVYPTTEGVVTFTPITYPFNTTVYYRVDVENAFLEESWSKTGSATSIQVVDKTTYTWIGGASSGLWTDSQNWSGNGASTPCIGYPYGGSGSCVAMFPADSTSVVSFTNDVISANIGFGTRSTVTFMSENGSGWCGGVNTPNGTIDINDDMTLNVIGAKFNHGQNGGIRIKNNATLNLLNGSQSSGFSKLYMSGANSVLYVDAESSAGPFYINPIELSGENAEIILDGGSFKQTTKEFLVSKGGVTTKGITFLGRTPRFAIENKFYVDGAGSSTLKFVVPEGGYADVPFVASSTYRLGEGGAAGNSRNIRVVVPATAPAAIAETEGDYTLISSASGIATEMFDLSQLPHPNEDYFYWTYDSTGANAIALNVHILGRAANPTAPVIRNLYVIDSTNTAATIGGEFRLGGTSPSAEFSYRFARVGEDYPAEYILLASSTTITNELTVALTGLNPGSEYKIEFKGSNAVGDTHEEYVFSTLGDVAVLQEATGYASYVTYGPYAVITYTNVDEVGTLKVSRGGAAEILVVGGGGAGGYAFGYHGGGGGGGAGGVVYCGDKLLSSGDYEITVGKGGASPASQSEVNDGAPSSITYGGRTIQIALGGGGGGSAKVFSGHDGGSGGGSTGANVDGGAGTEGQGCRGGAGWTDGLYRGAGGGGGAGEPGVDAFANSQGSNQKGGDGIACSITGYEVWYGGGGSGGASNGKTIAGGMGGGGASSYEGKGGDGVDGLGGGGAGGAGRTSSTAWTGGKGGDGVVIVRIRTVASSDAPIHQYRQTTVEGTSATIESEVFEFGGDANALSYKILWGFAPDALVYEHNAGEVSRLGIISTGLTGLPHQRLIYAKLVSTSATTDASVESDVFTFVTSGTTSTWSDATVPTLGDTSVDGTGGDTLALVSSLTSLGTDATTVGIKLLVSASADFASPFEWDLGNTVVCEIAKSIHTADTNAVEYIRPGTDYWCTLVARNDAGAVMASPVVQVQTLAGSAFNTVNAKVTQSKVTISGNLKSPIGCNDTVLTLRWTLDDGLTWSEEPLAVLNAASNTLNFAAEKDFGAFDVTVKFEIVSSNGCETASWTSKIEKSAVTDDVAEYRWKADADGNWDGDWEDPDHWEATLEPNYGYPRSRGCTANFSSIATDRPVTVSVSGVHTNIGIIRATVPYYTLTLKGKTPEARLGTVNENSTTYFSALNGVLTLDGLTLDLVSGGSRSGIKMNDAGNSLRLVNGATLNAATFELVSNSNHLEVVGSTLNCDSLFLNGSTATLLLDNGKINSSGSLAYYGGGNDVANVLIKGANSDFSIAKGEAPGRIRTADHIVFSIPEGGFKVGAPLHKAVDSTNNEKFNSFGDSEYPRTIELAEDSPVFRSGQRGVYRLISWPSGFYSVSNLTLKIPERFATVRGTPNRIFFVDANGEELSAEAIEAGAVVYGVNAELGGFGGTMIFVR